MVEETAVAPPQRTRTTSLGDLGSITTRRLLIDLISTLNASFPDYDFSVARPDSFRPLELSVVIQRVNSALAELTTQNALFIHEMWHAIDTVSN